MFVVVIAIEHVTNGSTLWFSRIKYKVAYGNVAIHCSYIFDVKNQICQIPSSWIDFHCRNQVFVYFVFQPILFDSCKALDWCIYYLLSKLVKYSNCSKYNISRKDSTSNRCLYYNAYLPMKDNWIPKLSRIYVTSPMWVSFIIICMQWLRIRVPECHSRAWVLLLLFCLN